MWLPNKNLTSLFFKKHTVLSKAVENVWRSWSQWNKSLFFSHGIKRARGVLVLVQQNLDFQLKNLYTDTNGHLILLEATIQDVPFFLCNIYWPNNLTDQISFFTNIKDILQENITESNSSVILGGDFNMIFDTDLIGSVDLQGSKNVSKLLKISVMLENDLMDI